MKSENLSGYFFCELFLAMENGVTRVQGLLIDGLVSRNNVMLTETRYAEFLSNWLKKCIWQETINHWQ